MVRSVSWIVSLICFAIAVAGGVGFFGYGLITQPGPLNVNTVVYIPKGSSVTNISRLLVQSGAVSYPLLFELTARTLGAGKMLHSGEYSIPKNESLIGILSILNLGKTVVHHLTVPEGLRTKEILLLLANMEGLTGTLTETPAEGELLPETYHYSRGDSRNELIMRMKVAMTKASNSLWAKRKPGLPIKTRREAIILASIIEKETGRDEERARVAAVFVNRLRRGMRLQLDPTVIYGLTKGHYNLGRSLTREDLSYPNPYNTYLNKGLPSGPIANPGRASIQAALNPIRTGELYFVADGKGGHLFASTLRQHNRNVEAWRKLLRDREEQN